MASTTLSASSPNRNSQIVSDETLLWHSAEDLLPWESDWRDIDQVADTPWSTWKGIHAMLLSCPSQEQPCIHGLQQGGKLVAMVPLAAHSIGKYYRLMPLGCQFHPFPFEIVATDLSARAALVREILSNDLPLTIPRMRGDSELMAVFQDECRKGTQLKIQQADPAFVLELTAGWADPLKSLASDRRSEFRLAQRRSEPFGPPEFKILRPQQADLSDVLSDIRALGQNAWKIQAEPPAANDVLISTFETAVLRKFSLSQLLRIHQILFQGKLAAIVISVEHQNRLWFVKCLQDPRFSKCLPSLQLMEKVIADAAKRNLESIEFPATQDANIHFWGPKPREQFSLKTIPYNRAGLGAWTSDLRQNAYQQMVTRWKAPWHKIAATTARPFQGITAFAARCYCAGGDILDAIAVQRRFHEAGFATMIGFQDDHKTTPETIAREYQLALRSLEVAPRATPRPALVVQATACDMNMLFLSELADICQSQRVRLCFDATWHAATDATLAAVEVLRQRGLEDLSMTLPARWGRSIADAKWAIEQGIGIRLVSGKYADPTGDVQNLRDNFLEIARQIAGHAGHVAIAVRDLRIAKALLEILGGGDRRGKPLGTSARGLESPNRKSGFELEVLYGTSYRAACRLARKWDADMRILIPYGRGELPYGFQHLLNQPQIALWFAHDLMGRYWKSPGRIAKV